MPGNYLGPQLGSTAIKVAPERILKFKSSHRSDLIAPVCLIAIIAASAFLRLYRLPELRSVGTDVSRDVLVTRSILEEHFPVLEGPLASFGNYHRGPAWYYLLLIPDWLSGGDPIGGALLIVLSDIAAMVLIFALARRLFGPAEGLVAAALYGNGPLIVADSQAVRQPYILPFAALLMLYLLVQIISGHHRYLLVLTPTWCIAIQVYESSFLFLLLFIPIWIINRPPVPIRIWLGAAALGMVTLVPFLIYETQNGFYDLLAMVEYLVGHQQSGTLSTGLLTNLNRLLIYFDGLFPGRDMWHTGLIALACVGILYVVLQLRHPSDNPRAILGVYLVLPLLLVLAPNAIELRFLTVFFGLPALLVAAGLNLIARQNKLAAAGLMALVLVIAAQSWDSIRNAIYYSTPGVDSATTVQEIVAETIREENGNPFNFQISSARVDANFDYPYRSYFDLAHTDSYGGAAFDSFILYDSVYESDTKGLLGVELNGVKLVHLKPLSVGPNLMMDHYYTLDADATNSGRDADGSLYVKNSLLDRPRSLLQQLDARPGDIYVLSFDYRNTLKGGNQFVTFGFRPTTGYVNKNPWGVRFQALPNQRVWRKGSLVIEVPEHVVGASVLLQNWGVGTAWFRNVSLNLIRYQVVAPVSNAFRQ